MAKSATGRRWPRAMGSVTKEMENHKTYIRRWRTELHRDQDIVERFNRTLAERLFGHQYAVEMLLPAGQRSMAWLKRLPDAVGALNNQVTRLAKSLPSQSKRKALWQNLTLHTQDQTRRARRNEARLCTRRAVGCLSHQTYSFRFYRSCETRSVQCESCPATPTLCHNKCSAPACAAHMWPPAH